MKQLAWVAVPFVGISVVLGIVAIFVLRANRRRAQEAQAAAASFGGPNVPRPAHYPPSARRHRRT